MQKYSIAQLQEKVDAMSDDEKQKFLPILLADDRVGVQNIAKKIIKQIKKNEKELLRLEKMMKMEKEFIAQGFIRIAGTDEAGRGPLAGPVVAAAVILSPEMDLRGIDDSKKISEKKREELAKRIMMHAPAYGIAEASVEEIDSLNVLHASELAMTRAIAQLGDVSLVLVDGTNRPKAPCPIKQVLHGDANSLSIAAASILAKVHRDHIMMKYDNEYPEYGFAKHKGYGTAEHYQALKKHGPLVIHRRSFDLKI